MAANDIQSGIYASLANIARFFVEQMKQKIDDVNAPKVIKEHISIDSPVVNPNMSYVDIKIDTSKDGAPMAGAYEFGSQPYRIPPDGEKFMAFPKEKWPTFDPSKWGNRAIPNTFVFTHVSHPAIVARPYIKPTILENKDTIRKMLAQDFKAYIIGNIQKVTVIE